MATLTTCIKKAGAALVPEDRDAILAAFNASTAAGTKPAEAARQAVDAQLAEVRKMLAGMGDERAAAEMPEEAPADILASEADLWKRVNAGTATVDEFRAGFERWISGKDEILPLLAKKTKAELLEMGGGMFAYRYKSETKPEIVEALWRDGASTYVLGRSYSYGMSSGSQMESIRRMVEATDADQLAQYAKDRKAAEDEAVARVGRKIEAIKDPKTLDDFRSFVTYHLREGKSEREIRLMLTPEQRANMDELNAEYTRSARRDTEDTQRSQVRVAGQAVDGEIIATKHTKHGHDLFVVRLAERVSREDYDTLNAGAKRLGGSYSSYRGNGAIPGFQFRTREAAEAFNKLAGGDNSAAVEAVKERRDAFADDRSQTAVERLGEMADRLDERADESLGGERKANTERRARFAASAEASARADKAMAKTMRNLAGAIQSGAAKFLDRVRQKAQVELLQTYVQTAQGDELRAKFPSYADQERNKGAPPTAETADFAEFPNYTAYRSDLASLGRQLLEVDGTKKMGERIMKVADDTSDAFTAFAKEPGNLFKLSTFSVRAGDDVRAAIFPTREGAERAIQRSGLSGKAIVFPEKRGVNRIIMSPSEAMARGIWKGDGDKRITFTADFGAELVEKIGKAARRGAKVSVPWQFERAYDRRKTLARMGIETGSEFRAALREFIGLREQPAEPDKIKAMERAMIGRRNDGLDFFPTPESVADEMVAAADIQPGMRVLEPSAGMGHIAERIRGAEVDPEVVEYSNDRRELLEAKGFNVIGTDFLHLSKDANGEFDRILMNPPFSDGRDTQHVRHAYSLLKPGGRLVAIMGESAFTNQNKRATEFREWLDSAGGTEEKLAEGTFNDPSLPVNTGANARMVVIDKPEGGAPLLSRSTDTTDTTGIDPATLTTWAKDTAAKWADAPRISVAATVADLPADIQAALKSRNAENDARALIILGKNPQVWLVASNLTGMEDAQFALWHEVLGHYGLRTVLGGSYANQLALLKMANPKLKAEAQEWMRKNGAVEIQARVSQGMKMDEASREVSLLSVEEALANRAGRPQELKGWRRFMARLQALLREKGLGAVANRLESKTQAETLQLLASARKAVELGSTAKMAEANLVSSETPALSRNDKAANVLSALSQNDDLFQLPASDGKTVKDIAADIDPAIRVTKLDAQPGQKERYRIDMEDGRSAYLVIRSPNPYGPSLYSFDLADGEMTNKVEMLPGENIQAIPEDIEEVFIDASKLKEGSGGAKVYAIASALALNTDRLFIGDPAGLSDEALRRRTENMLSSALRYGTTEHLAPHPRQVQGDAKLGIPPLRWVYGDHTGNIRRLIDVNLKALDNAGDGEDRTQFNPDNGLYQAGSGREVPGVSLAQAVADHPDARAGVGGRTLARAAVWRALLREESSRSEGEGRRDGLLADLARLADDRPQAVAALFSRASDTIGTTGGAGAVAAGSTPLPLPAETRPRQFQRLIQDNLNRFNVLRNFLTEQGVTLTDSSNVWEFEERMHGRIASRSEDFREKRIKPLIGKIQKAGFTMEQVAEFLHAQHAKERNDQIEKIDPTNTSGSGMTTADAANILAAADPRLKALSNELRAVTDDTRQILLDAGIINQDTVDAWQNAYKHYVPLKGEGDPPQGTGKALSVNGRQKRAMGHGERAEFIVENILRDHERAIALAEKNTVGHSLLKFIMEADRPDMATIGKPEKRKVLVSGAPTFEVVDPTGAGVQAFDEFDDAMEFIRQGVRNGLSGANGLTIRQVKGDPFVKSMARPLLAENEAQVYVKGHSVRIQLNDPLLARAYLRIGVEGLNALMRVNRQINGMLSKAYTAYNPAFFLKNIVRDFTSGTINILGKYGSGVTAATISKYPKAFGHMLRYSYAGKSTPLIDAYRAAGGSTGAAYLGDIERIGADVKAAFEEYEGVMAALKTGHPGRAAKVAGLKLVKTLTAVMEHLNAAGENSMRVAVFDAVRSHKGNVLVKIANGTVVTQVGYTENDAASAAKNATINFNRKGELTPALGALYLFFNPAVQGTASMMNSLVNGRHKSQAWALTAAVAALVYILRMQWDDDDGEKLWRSIPEYTKDRNILIRTGAESWVAIPIPYDYGVLFQLGNSLADLQRGDQPSHVALKIASSVVDSAIPMKILSSDSPSAGGLVELVPGVFGGELFRAGARVAANRSGLGGEIVPASQYDEGKPDSQRLYRTTKGTVYDKTAVALNDLTGGSKTQPGAVDVSPETLKFWTNTLTGGLGKFVADSAHAINLTAKAATAKDPKEAEALKPTAREVPIVRDFVGQTDVKTARGAFWDAYKEVDKAAEDFKRAKKALDAEGATIADQRAYLRSIAGHAEAARKMATAMRDRVDGVMADETKSLGYKRLAAAEFEKAEKKAYDQFLTVYATALKERRSKSPAAAVPAH